MGFDTTPSAEYSKVPLDEAAASAAPVAPSLSAPTPSSSSSADGIGMHFQWGADPRGDWWRMCELSPCCGDPCTLSSGLYCCFNWFCCSPCSTGKLLASSAGVDECTVANHCLPWYLFALIDHFVPPLGSMMTCGMLANMRRNLRVRQNVGDESISIGDFLMHCLPCLAPCAQCQELRSVPIESWDWMAQISEKGIKFAHDGPLLSAYVPTPRPAPTPMVMSDAAPVPGAPPAMTYVAPPAGTAVEMMPYPLVPPTGAVAFAIGPDGQPIPYGFAMPSGVPPPHQ